MISNSKQNWSVGALVKVGFISGLLVVAAIQTPGDFAPDAYILSRNNQFYSFVPHNGLSKIDAEEVASMVAESHRIAARSASAALNKAAASAKHAELINALMTA